MRLFIPTPSHYLEGGVERILDALARELPARGIDVTFGLARGARFHDPERFLRAFPNVKGIELDARSGTAYARRRALRRAIARIDPDVVLNMRLFDTYPACAAMKLDGHRLRLVATVHGFESAYFVDLARYADFVDAAMTSGEWIADAVRRFTRVTEVASIAGGVAPPQRTRVPHGGPLRIGYVGRLEHATKRVLDLIPLIETLQRRGVPFSLRVVGAGADLETLRQRLPQVMFDGWLPVEELYERVYPELDVFVHFSEWEGLTIAPREAMAHGVVPVISRFRGAEDFSDGENALTFTPGDLEAAAAAVERLQQDRVLLEQLSQNARASQSGARSARGAIDRWEALLRGTLDRPSKTGLLPPVRDDEGVLSRLRVPPPLAELVRTLRRRVHSDPGSEWPHWSGLHEPRLEQEIETWARS